MNQSMKSRLAIDLDALEEQLKHAHKQHGPRQASSNRPRGSDPLTELARIVGQDDPYRNILASEPRSPDDHAGDAPADAQRRRLPRILPDESLRADVPTDVRGGAVSAHLQMPVFDEAALRGTLGQAHLHGASQLQHGLEEAADPHSPHESPGGQVDENRTDDPFESDTGEEAISATEAGDAPAGPIHRHGFAAALAARQGGSMHEAEHVHDDRRYAAQNDETEHGYDPRLSPPPEPPSERRWRRGLMVAAAVVSVGVIGVAGLLALRGSGSRAASGEPPVIKADVAPVKVAAKDAAEEAPRPTKQIYERSTSAGAQDTKVVNNAEQPVDINQVVRTSSQQASGNAAGADKALSFSSAPQASGLGKGDEPKRVKVVSVRPDGSLVSEPQQSDSVHSRPTQQGGQPASRGLSIGLMPGQAQGQTPQRQATSQSTALGTPSQDGSQGQGQAQPQASQSSTSSQASSGAPGKIEGRVGDEKSDRASEGRASAPLSIATDGSSKTSGQSQTAAQPNSQPSRRVAAVDDSTATTTKIPAVSQPERQTRSAAVENSTSPRAALTAAADGGFAVQLAAPASEQEAREIFATLQRKHAQELSGRRPVIRQAQVGGRALWRLRVSAGSRQDATALCTKLQAAGGACFVAKE